jgi:hypothetical protein
MLPRTIRLANRMPGTADRPSRAQMRLQLLLQHPAGLNEQAAIDRLVRHPIRLVIRIGALQPAGNLLRRPVLFQLAGNKPPHIIIGRQLAQLGTQRSIPGSLVSRRGAVAAMTAVAA